MTARSGGTVGDFMHRYLEVVPPETTILEAAERKREESLGSLLVESTDPQDEVGTTGLHLLDKLAPEEDRAAMSSDPSIRDRQEPDSRGFLNSVIALH